MLAAKVRAEIRIRNAAAVRFGVSPTRLIFGTRLLGPGTLIHFVAIVLPIVIRTHLSLSRGILGFPILTLDVGLTLLLPILVLFFLLFFLSLLLLYLTVLRRLLRVLAFLILLIRGTRLILPVFLPVLRGGALIPVFILSGC